MAPVDLDDELARFEAELKALEQQQQQTETPVVDVASSTKRMRDDDSATQLDEPTQKRAATAPAPAPATAAATATAAAAAVAAPSKPLGLGGSKGLAKPVVATETVVIRAAPKIYMAPPRPAPVKKPFDPSPAFVAPASASASAARPAAPMPSLGRPGVANTVDEVFARRGALSGFPMGVTGERAAALAKPQLPQMAQMSQMLVPRFDPMTGQYVSPEEQQLVMQQQSVYEYDPSRPVTTQQLSTNQLPATEHSTSTTQKPKKPKKLIRVAGGEQWTDETLADWPDNDFRLFCGDLGNEVSDEVLAHSFSRYATFQRARVVRDKHSHKSRGYGFVSFADPLECVRALREMNGKYIGNRPVKLSKSRWQDRNLDVAKKKMKKKNRHLFT